MGEGNASKGNTRKGRAPDDRRYTKIKTCRGRVHNAYLKYQMPCKHLYRQSGPWGKTKENLSRKFTWERNAACLLVTENVFLVGRYKHSVSPNPNIYLRPALFYGHMNE